MVSDYQNDFSAGQNNGIGQFLSRSSYHQGINVTGRRGYLESREPDVQIALSESVEDRYQGSEVYNPGTGDRIITVCGGNIYEIWPSGATRRITSEPLLSRTVERCYFVQANHYMIIQDGINLPVVLEDTKAEVSDTVPIGRWMSAGNGYLAVVSPNCKTVFVSNISTFLEDPDHILKFTETPSSLTPFDIGDIVGIHLAPILDAGTSMGALMVFGRKLGRVFAYDLSVPRDEWGNTVGFGRTVAEGIFLASNASIQAIGGDLYMRTVTGIDTINLARADWQASRNRSISQPIDGWLDQDAPHLLRVCQSAFWDDRFYLTTQPVLRFDSPEIIHQAAAVYDVRHGLESAPAYPGIEWGTFPLAFHVVDGALLTVGKRQEGPLLLFRRLPRGSRGSATAPWRVDTRAFDWDNPVASKTLLGGDSYLHVEFGRPGEITLSYRTDISPNWNRWHTLRAHAAPGSTSLFQVHSEPMALPGLPEVNQRRSFRWLQLRLEGSVPVKLREIHLAAELGRVNPLEPGQSSGYVEATSIPFTYTP